MPLLYLHGLSSLDFGPALEQFLRSGAGLSAATITRLTTQWQDEARLFADRSIQEAVERASPVDLAAVEHALADDDLPFRQRLRLRLRLRNAFDYWAGRYIGPLTREVAALVEENPDRLGPVVQGAPQSFARLITDALVM